MDEGSVDYRWTSQTPMLWRFHWTILLFFPLLFVFAALHHFKLYVCVLAAYAVFLLLASRRKLGPVEYIGYLWIRYIYGFQWRVR